MSTEVEGLCTCLRCEACAAQGLGVCGDETTQIDGAGKGCEEADPVDLLPDP